MELSLDMPALKREVNMSLYGKVKDQAVQQNAQLLADFAQAQPQASHPVLGRALDIRI